MLTSTILDFVYLFLPESHSLPSVVLIIDVKQNPSPGGPPWQFRLRTFTKLEFMQKNLSVNYIVYLQH